MKYLHIIATLNPAQGGPSEGVRQLTTAAMCLGHEVEIVALDLAESPWLKDYACPIHALGSTQLGKYQYSARLDRWLRQNAAKYDAIIVNGLWQYHGFATWRALRNTATPYYVFTHGMLDPWFRYEYPLKHLKKWCYWPWAEYRVLRDARAVLFTCEEERQQARRSFGLYRANEQVVSYGTPGPSGSAESQRAAFLQRFPHLRGQRLVLFLGRIHPKKGCDLLIEAFAAIASRDPALHLVIAGPDDAGLQSVLARRAQQLTPEQVTWTGMLQGDLKWGALHAAEVFALPSHQENFGIAVAEALSCGVPVLISNKVNIWREIVTDGAGLVADDSLAGTVQLLQSWFELSPPERQAMSHHAIECFKKRFHIDAAAHSLLAVLQSNRVTSSQRLVA